jgi:hypothetical protein
MEDRYTLNNYPHIIVDMGDGRAYKLDFRLLKESDVSISFQIGFMAGLIDNPQSVNLEIGDVKAGFALGEKIRLKETDELPIWLKL